MPSDDFLERFPPETRLRGKEPMTPETGITETMSDAELVALTQGGDLAAFNQLVGRWESSLYGFVRRTLGDAEDARDVCQEAMVKAFRPKSALRPKIG